MTSTATAPLFTLDDLHAAADLVHAHVPPTPQFEWPLLSSALGATVSVKHENHTPTGAFKVRGGLVYMDRLARERPEVGGVVSATRGNHGQSIAFAGRVTGTPVTIVAPVGNSPDKNASMRGWGAELIEHGHDFQAAREHAEALAAERGLEMVPSYHVDLVLGVADIDLVYLRLSAVLCAADRILGPRPGAAKRRVRHGGGDPVNGRPALMANKIGAPRLGARPARSGRT